MTQLYVFMLESGENLDLPERSLAVGLVLKRSYLLYGNFSNGYRVCSRTRQNKEKHTKMTNTHTHTHTQISRLLNNMLPHRVHVSTRIVSVNVHSKHCLPTRLSPDHSVSALSDVTELCVAGPHVKRLAAHDLWSWLAAQQCRHFSPTLSPRMCLAIMMAPLIRRE